MWFLFKTTVIVVIAVLMRGTLPRYRIDNLITYYWKYMLFSYIFFYIELLCVYYYYVVIVPQLIAQAMLEGLWELLAISAGVI